MNKARAGKPESIRKCIGCMYCRERLLGNAMPVECSLNPRLGPGVPLPLAGPPEERQQPPPW